MSLSQHGKKFSNLKDFSKKCSDRMKKAWIEGTAPGFKKGHPNYVSVETNRERGLRARGEKNCNWKGGYENHLMHNRQRYWKKKGILGFHSQEQWLTLKSKYNNMCLCCKKFEPEIVLTEDHIIPITKGGTNDISNIQPLCRSCNSRKYNKIISYLELSESIRTGVNI